jgi:peptidoglycan hydrolase CwlO-like protein
MLRKRIICILLAIILIVSYSVISFASDTNQVQNDESNNEIFSNNILSTEEMNQLNEQKNELDSKIEEANHKLCKEKCQLLF